MEIRIGGPVDDSALDPDLLLHIVVVMVDPRVPVVLPFHNFIISPYTILLTDKIVLYVAVPTLIPVVGVLA